MRILLLLLTLLVTLVEPRAALAGTKQALPSVPAGNTGTLAERLPGGSPDDRTGQAPRSPVITPDHTKDVMKEMTRDIQRARQSRLERAYNDRLDTLDRPLEQFGYAVFTPEKQGRRIETEDDDTAMPPGAVQDDYILQPGDKVYVIIRGQHHHRKAYTIGSSGKLVIKHFEPLNAAGRTIAEIRQALRQQAEQLANTRLYLSLHDINGLGIDVIGHVKQPGHYRLTSFHTVVDALRKAGGISKSGSLRRVKLVRRDGERQTIDLYNYLLNREESANGSGMSGTTQLRVGDRIIVPPVGPTVAAAGAFQRPGIYELAGGKNALKLRDTGSTTTLAELAGYTGGAMPGASHRLLRMRLDSEGYERIHPAKGALADIALNDGDILMLRQREAKRTDHVRLTGHVSSPGIYSLSEAGSLSRLIDQNTLLKPGTYPLFAVIRRYDPGTMAIQHKSFSPLAVKKGRSDIDLQSGDHVIFFRYADIRDHIGARHAEDDRGDGETGVDRQKQSTTDTNTNQRAGGVRRAQSGPRTTMHTGMRLASRTQADPGLTGGEEASYMTPALLKVMRRSTLSVRGNILHPGHYPVAGNAPARRIIDAAGGITGKRDKSRIEITSLNSDSAESGESDSNRTRQYYAINDTDLRTVRLEAGDSLHVNSADDDYAVGRTRITGAVQHPGEYDIMPGDTLLTLIKRAGGLTKQAYPAGAILSRERARKRERQRFTSKARDLEMRLARFLSDDSNNEDEPGAARINTMRNLITDLRKAKAVGRITVEADPQILKNSPEQDVLLEDGDHLHMPKRPATVRVAGEVLSPAALQFKSGKTPGDYITSAGGFTANADQDRAFILYPDGHAKPIDTGLWNNAPLKIPPGTTVVVPRDMDNFKFLENTRDITQILSNVATAALFADDIGD